MRLKLIAMVITGIFATSAITAANANSLAESTDNHVLTPWEFTGSLTLRATDDRGVGNDNDYRLNLTATKELLPNLTFKTTVTSFSEKLFPTSNSTSKSIYIDQYALKYALPDNKSTLHIGKDDLLYGNGLIMGDNLKNITFATTVDNLNIQVSTFKNKYVPADSASSIGGSIQTSFDKCAFGTSYIKQNDDSFKNWAINAAYPVGKVTLAAEYTKNTAAATAQNAYYLTATYGSLEKQGDCRFSVGYVRAERNALPAYASLDLTTAADYKGTTMAVNYQLSTKSVLTLEHNRLRDMSDSDVSRTRLTHNLTF
ncbi:porin [Sporomusa sp.]|uniref:porin n=1 Tax=Sporomusa sp. TaxID=2078658 RepID=UPI002CCA891B|nr:porin [Sporomusa sp.]HWR42808.1 porin [Sporomusa sp.]